MELEEFQHYLATADAKDVSERFLTSTEVAAFSTELLYEEFKTRVIDFLDDVVEHVALVGTSNWNYSLNPRKNYKTFDEKSDVDVAVVSQSLFMSTWLSLRGFHRDRFYSLSYEERMRLRRNGENVYCGFISPSWIPERQNLLRYNFKSICNRLSDKQVDYKPVKMLFFRNFEEAIDYYKRGILEAKRKLSNEI